MDRGHPTCNAYLAEEFKTNAVQNFPVGKEAAVITTVLDLTEKVSAGSGGRRAAASHHKLGARLPAYEGVVSWATRLSAKEASEFRPISATATRDSPAVAPPNATDLARLPTTERRRRGKHVR